MMKRKRERKKREGEREELRERGSTHSQPLKIMAKVLFSDI